MSYIVIPIFSDPYLHPLHKNNGLSLLYVKGSDGGKQMICQFHPDCTGVLEDYKWLEDKLIFTPDAKVLEHIHPFKNVIDMNWLWWSKTNQPFDIESIRNNAYDFLHNKKDIPQHGHLLFLLESKSKDLMISYQVDL